VVLQDLGQSLGKLYASGRPSIPPEQLLSALLLQVFYGIRSERQLIEQSTTIFSIAGSLVLLPTTPCGTTFTKNRERLQQGEVFQKFMVKLLNHSQSARMRRL
jgi:transposase